MLLKEKRREGTKCFLAKWVSYANDEAWARGQTLHNKELATAWWDVSKRIERAVPSDWLWLTGASVWHTIPP
jgi:hypothetical protein